MKSIGKVLFVTQHSQNKKQHVFLFNFSGISMTRVEFVFHCLARCTEADCITPGINDFLNDIYDDYHKQ